MKREMQTYKVRCSVTYACYAFVDGSSEDDARRRAKKWFSDCDPEAEASHIHQTFEVEEI